MIKIYLDRQNITGSICEDTPICVILEIADSLHLNYDSKKVKYPEYIHSIISTIKTCPIPCIDSKKEYNLDELSLIAKFINADSSIMWRRKKVLEAFNHILKYTEKEPPIPTGEWDIGQQTMNTPLSYNSCVLYKTCKYYGLYTNRNTTINNMAYSVRLLSNNNSELINKIINITKFLNKASLINILCNNNISIVPNLKFINHSSSETMENLDFFQSKNLEESYKKLSDPQAVSLITPNNQYECIYLAAKLYNIDISESENPHKEYLKLKEGHYIPQDKNFMNRYVKNPSFFLVDKNWRPNLTCLYDINQLTKFAKNEGYTDEDLINSSPLELLSTNIDTFYKGRHPDSINDTTLISLENLSEIEPDLIISYKKDDIIEAFDISELINYFKINRTFLHPIRKNLKFSEFAIKKLRYICKHIKSNENINKSYQELLENIYIIENIEYTNIKYNQNFVNITDKDILIQNLNIILEIALYMRGWNGVGEYPLYNSPHIDNEENIWKAIKKY